jgi:hypothetical protein
VSAPRRATAEDGGLTRRQAQSVTALLTSRTVEEAAESAGVGARTLERWLADDVFAAQYRSAARDASQQAVSALLAAQLGAVAVLRAALVGGTAASRIRAARCLLELGVKVAERDLDERLDTLEAEVNRWTATNGVTPAWRNWSA